MDDRCDIAVVGAGAAGLMAAIWAGRTARARATPLRVVALDGARTLGAKILVAGGGRCNVTHDVVTESDFAGSTPKAIATVLRRFDVPAVREFFRELGVKLKREETGKLFPVTDRARTVLDALLRAVREAGVELRHPARVLAVEHRGARFLLRVSRPDAPDTEHTLSAHRVVLATGGKALPRTGSDGLGYELLRALGHTITPVFPALVPLMLADGESLRELAGVTADAEVHVLAGTGRRVRGCRGSVLITHFGLSGPAILDISRSYLDQRRRDEGARISINWTPTLTSERLDALLIERSRRSPSRVLSDLLPERLARALCRLAGVDASRPMHELLRDARRRLVTAVTAHEPRIVADRGFTHAEATAGGVPLAELKLDTLESRGCHGLHVCGEVCDVDGRIGGFNFQWAWASGFVAGAAAAGALLPG